MGDTEYGEGEGSAQTFRREKKKRGRGKRRDENAGTEQNRMCLECAHNQLISFRVSHQLASFSPLKHCSGNYSLDFIHYFSCTFVFNLCFFFYLRLSEQLSFSLSLPPSAPTHTLCLKIRGYCVNAAFQIQANLIRFI